uniref:Uncharacterized protein n=1 Tax=Romanomermis culicivorax TaxID=13658 RepID=A0A915JFE4_ROMCU
MLVEPTLPESEIQMGKEVLGRVGMAMKAALQFEYALKSYTDPENMWLLLVIECCICGDPDNCVKDNWEKDSWVKDNW